MMRLLRPRLAVRRVMARQASETLVRGYDGAARGRRTEGWRAPDSSADTEIGVAGALLRDRMRDLVHNNPHAAKAVAVLVSNIIGAALCRAPPAETTRWLDLARDAERAVDGVPELIVATWVATRF